MSRRMTFGAVAFLALQASAAIAFGLGWVAPSFTLVALSAITALLTYDR